MLQENGTSCCWWWRWWLWFCTCWCWCWRCYSLRSFCGWLWWRRTLQKGSKTHKRLKERLLIGWNRTSCAHFRGSLLFQATYNIKKHRKKQQQLIQLVSVGCGRLAGGKGLEIDWRDLAERNANCGGVTRVETLIDNNAAAVYRWVGFDLSIISWSLCYAGDREFSALLFKLTEQVWRSFRSSLMLVASVCLTSDLLSNSRSLGTRMSARAGGC